MHRKRIWVPCGSRALDLRIVELGALFDLVGAISTLFFSDLEAV